MKIFIVVEGDSDKILFEGQRNWFDSLGLELTIIPTDGKPNMIKTSKKHYTIAKIMGADYIIFLPDQNSDVCAMVTRDKIDIDYLDKAITIVMKREMEAWIIADGKCIRDSILTQYRPAGSTDIEIDPKGKLHTILKRKLGYTPTTIEAITIVAPHFSINRSATNNNSAKRFKEFIESISDSNYTR